MSRRPPAAAVKLRRRGRPVAAQPRGFAAVGPPRRRGTVGAVAVGMRRPACLALPLLALTACIDLTPELDIPPLFTCEHPLFPASACVDADHPVDFYDDWIDLALAGQSLHGVLTLDGLAYTLQSDQPAVVELTDHGDGNFTLHGLATGVASISARDPSGRVLASVSVQVAPIASAELSFATAGPVSSLAALPGATERIRVVARDAHGIDLAGAEAAIEFTATGAVSTAAPGDAELRGGSISWGVPAEPGFDAAFHADALGAGTLTATVDGAQVATLPIDVIPAADAVELRLAAPSTSVNWYQLIDLIGTDATGRPVAGLVADFVATPAERATLVRPRGGQAVLRTLAVGTVTVTATLPDRTLTTTFEIVTP